MASWIESSSLDGFDTQKIMHESLFKWHTTKAGRVILQKSKIIVSSAETASGDQCVCDLVQDRVTNDHDIQGWLAVRSGLGVVDVWRSSVRVLAAFSAGVADKTRKLSSLHSSLWFSSKASTVSSKKRSEHPIGRPSVPTATGLEDWELGTHELVSKPPILVTHRFFQVILHS